jgi:hypothetical protein
VIGINKDKLFAKNVPCSNKLPFMDVSTMKQQKPTNHFRTEYKKAITLLQDDGC